MARYKKAGQDISKGLKKIIKLAVQSTSKGVQKATKKQNTRKREKAKQTRDYMRLYNKLELYSQSPLQPTKKINKTEIERLSRRWETVNEYQKILRRYQKSVSGFNEKYLQNVNMPESSDRITQASLKALQKRYDKWKKYRRNFVRRIANEPENIVRQIEKFLNQHMDFIAPDKFTGDYSNNDYRIVENLEIIRDIITSWIPEEEPARTQSLKRIKRQWKEVTEYMNIIIYESKKERRAQALAMLHSIITGDGTNKGKGFDIGGEPLEDMAYE